MKITLKWIAWIIEVISFITILNAMINEKPTEPSQFGIDPKLMPHVDSIISKQREERAMLSDL